MKITNLIVVLYFSLFTSQTMAQTMANDSDYSQSIDVTHYNFNYDLNLENSGWRASGNRLKATTTITLINKGGKDLNSIPLLLKRLMKVTDIKASEDPELFFSQNLQELKNFDLFQANVITIKLARPIKPNQQISLAIMYEGALAGAVETGMAYTRETLDPAFTILRSETLGYPYISKPDWLGLRKRWQDDFDWTATFTLPKTHKVATGHTTTTKVNGEKAVINIKSIVPQSVPYFPIGPYVEVKNGKNHIFALPGNEEGVKRLSNYMNKTLQLYEEWFGEMPNDQGFALTEIPEMYGSQVILPTVIQTSNAFNDKAGLDQLFHEMSHLWNLKDTNSLSPRLNEGLATFLQKLTAKKFGTIENFENEMTSILKRVKANFTNGEYKKIPINQYGEERITGMSYTVGSLFYYVLFQRLGQEQFLTLLKSYYQDNRGGDASLKTMASYYQKNTNVPVEDIFNDWIFSNAYVEKIEKATSLDELL